MNDRLDLPYDQTYESRYATIKMCNPQARLTGEFVRIPKSESKYKEAKDRRRELGKTRGKCMRLLGIIWRHTFAIWEEWIILFFMAIIVAIISFIMDKIILAVTNARIWLFYHIATHPFERYIAWISLPVCLILFSHGWICILAPHSSGSGIPEIKTILCGVAMKEFLTFRTLLAKMIGASATVGSGMPLGKKGPLIHIASVTVRLLTKLVMGFHGMYESEGRSTEMLASACAVGVACTFYAPIAGVLMSIELTTSYFAIRNYWRCFFASVVGATFYKLLYVWNFDMNTIGPNFKTNFTMDLPFHPNELIVFGLMGAVCGVVGAFFVWVHRTYVTFLKTNKFTTAVMKRMQFVYPGLVSLAVASLIYPPGLGQFMAGHLPSGAHVTTLFSNFPWTNYNLTVEQQQVVNNWLNPYTGIYINLLIFICYTFIFAIITSAIPVPSGSFIPVFKIGAAFGRIIGEAMHLWWLSGIWYGSKKAQIIPGGYAIVGAAALAAAVSRTLSVAILTFEMTGQLTHVIPVLIAVLVANGVGSLIAPGMFDSIIVVKKLPYLPELLPTSSAMYSVFVEDFMIENVKFVHHDMTYNQLKTLLKENRNILTFPLVDNPLDMILLGSIHRLKLIDLIEDQVGRERRLYVAAIRKKRSIFRNLEADEDKRNINGSRFKVTSAEIVDDGEIFNNQNGKLRDLPGFEGFSEIDPKYIVSTKSRKSKTKMRKAFDAMFSNTNSLPFDRGEEFKAEMLQKEKYKPRIVPLDEYWPERVQPIKYVQDMTSEERQEWEADQYMELVDFSSCPIDPAPFQVVVGTSLLKVHSFFSMVGINFAYVTSKSKLVGVVGVKELRKVIQDVNSNKLSTPRLDRTDRIFYGSKSGHYGGINQNKASVIKMRDENDKSLGQGKPTKV